MSRIKRQGTCVHACTHSRFCVHSSCTVSLYFLSFFPSHRSIVAVPDFITAIFRLIFLCNHSAAKQESIATSQRFTFDQLHTSPHVTCFVFSLSVPVTTTYYSLKSTHSTPILPKFPPLLRHTHYVFHSSILSSSSCVTVDAFSP